MLMKFLLMSLQGSCDAFLDPFFVEWVALNEFLEMLPNRKRDLNVNIVRFLLQLPLVLLGLLSHGVENRDVDFAFPEIRCEVLLVARGRGLGLRVAEGILFFGEGSGPWLDFREPGFRLLILLRELGRRRGGSLARDHRRVEELRSADRPRREAPVCGKLSVLFDRPGAEGLGEKQRKQGVSALLGPELVEQTW